jgi:hypothetical protein
MGKHCGRPDPNEPVRPGAYVDGEPVERTVAMFEGSYGSAVTAAADKRLRGQSPYDLETGSKGPVDSRGVRRDDNQKDRRGK